MNQNNKQPDERAACAHDYARTDGVCTECGGSTIIANCPSKHCPQAAQHAERATFFDEFMESWWRTHAVSQVPPTAREAFENGWDMARATTHQANKDDDRTPFEAACDALPEGVNWGDVLTPDIVQHVIAYITTQQANRAQDGFEEWYASVGAPCYGSMKSAMRMAYQANCAAAPQAVALSDNQRAQVEQAICSLEHAGFKHEPTDLRALLAAPHVVALSDEQIIERCKAAGIKWMPPEPPDDVYCEMGFPGSFDMVSMDEMRALLVAHPAEQHMSDSDIDAMVRSVCHSDPMTKDGEYCLTVDEVRALLAAHPESLYEEHIRYCPECGHLGDVKEGTINCCPDGNRARVIPKQLAEISAKTFKLAIGGEQRMSDSEQQADLAVTGTPTEKGIYAWIANGSAALVHAHKRPTDHSPGNVLNGSLIHNCTFYDGCAIDQWTGGTWFGPLAARPAKQRMKRISHAELPDCPEGGKCTADCDHCRTDDA